MPSVAPSKTAWIVLALVLGLASDARADQAKAIEEFQKGRALAVAGRCEEAIVHFRASLAIAPAIGPLMNLGDCLAKTGRTASALKAFEQSAELARKMGDTERSQASEQMLASLRGSASTLTIHSASAGGKATVDGQPHPLNTPVPLDGGDHTIILETKQGHRTTASVHLNATSDAQTVEMPEEAPEPAPSHPARPFPRAQKDDPRTLRTVGFVSGGLGVAALAVGSVLGVTVLNSRSELGTMCGDYPRCARSREEEVTDLHRSAESRATFATVSLVAGAALAASAILFFVLDARRDTRDTRQSR